MNAIEIRDLKKSFRGMYALNGLNMTVPVGSIYGFIGENGSGKSTTEKLICGHLVSDSGTIKLFGKDCTDAGVRVRVGALIENARASLSSEVGFCRNVGKICLRRVLGFCFKIFFALSSASSIACSPEANSPKA